MYLKLGTEISDAILTPKEMVLLLKDLAENNPNLANQLMPILFHFIPSEHFKFQILVGISRKLMEIEIHYDGLSRKWRTQQIQHKELTSTITTEEKDEKTVVEKALGKELTDDDYKAFLVAHEKDAKIDYFNIQANFHRVTSRILAYAKLMKKFTEMPRFGKIKHALARKAEKPLVLPSSVYGVPSQRRKRRVTV